MMQPKDDACLMKSANDESSADNVRSSAPARTEDRERARDQVHAGDERDPVRAEVGGPTDSEIQIQRNAETVSLDVIVDRFEKGWSRCGPEIDVMDYLPAPGHARYDDAVAELFCIDLERRWRHAVGKSVYEYQRQYPKVFSNPRLLQQLAFEEYRVRDQLGDSVSRAEYAERYRVATQSWPPATETCRVPYQVPHVRPRPTATELDVGDWFLDFEILERLSPCRLGAVYLARQKQLGERPVVLKLSAEVRTELDCLSRLQHTDVVPIHSVHEYDGVQAVCMPFYGRLTLADVLSCLCNRKSCRPPQRVNALMAALDGSASTVSEIADVVKQEHVAVSTTGGPTDVLKEMSFEQVAIWLALRLAEALGHAHDRGIVHRDVKPANILMSHDGHPMLLDFNLSKRVDSVAKDSRYRKRYVFEDRHDVARESPNEAPREFGGTLAYMPPEQLCALANGEGDVDAQSDLYALGIVLFELLTGRLPFNRAGHSQFIAFTALLAAGEKKLPAIREHDPKLSPATESIIQRCLAPQLEDRYQSAHELCEDLRRQLEWRPLMHAPDRNPRERIRKWFRRHPFALSFGGLALTLIVALITALGLLSVRSHRVAEFEAKDRYLRFQELTNWAQSSLIAPLSSAVCLEDGLERARTALEIYEPLSLVPLNPKSTLRDSAEYRRLTATQQATLSRQLRDLLFLVAQVPLQRSRNNGTVPALQSSDAKPPSYASALNANLVAQDLSPREAVPSVLIRQQIELLSALNQSDSAAERRRQLDARPRVDDDYLAAVAAIHEGNHETAGIHVRRLLAERPSVFSVRFLAAFAAFSARDYQLAEEALTGCTVIWPESFFGHYYRGLTRLKRNNASGAERDFSVALELSGGEADVRFNRAVARLQLEDAAGALADLDTSLALAPKFCRAWLTRSRIHLALGNLEQAESDRTQGLDCEPRFAIGWYHRGMARRHDQPLAALSDFDRALELCPELPRALDAKSDLLIEKLNRPQDAVEALTRQIDLQPNNLLALIRRAELWVDLGEYDHALRDVHDVYGRQPENDLCFRVARVLVRCALPSDINPSERIAAKINTDMLSLAIPVLADALRLEPHRLDECQRDPYLRSVTEHPDFHSITDALLKLQAAIVPQNSLD